MPTDCTMKEKNVFITGATDGIGRATAVALARLGANLYILCRDAAKGEALRQELNRQSPKAVVKLFTADLGNFQAVRQAADGFLSLNIPLHVLINNAGLLNTSRKLLPNGLEQMFAVNHLGHFLLTQLLMDALKKPEKARVVVVASGAYILCKGIQFDDLSFENGFKTFKTYGHSKLANILFARSLAERLQGTGITVNALHPGEVRTHLGTQNARWINALLTMLSPILKTAAKGAETSVHLASSADVEGVSGAYFVDCRVRPTKSWANDRQQAERLRNVSEALIAG